MHTEVLEMVTSLPLDEGSPILFIFSKNWLSVSLIFSVAGWTGSNLHTVAWSAASWAQAGITHTVSEAGLAEGRGEALGREQGGTQGVPFS